MSKNDGNPIDPTERLTNAPRCTAMAKSTRQRCRNPSKQNSNVCRLHGAGGGAPRGPKHGNYRHGLRTLEATAIARAVSSICKRSKS